MKPTFGIHHAGSTDSRCGLLNFFGGRYFTRTSNFPSSSTRQTNRAPGATSRYLRIWSGTVVRPLVIIVDSAMVNPSAFRSAMACSCQSDADRIATACLPKVQDWFQTFLPSDWPFLRKHGKYPKQSDKAPIGACEV